MKKLGQINDAHLLKKAAGNIKAENGVKQLIAGKIAMFDKLITEAERVSFTKMNKEARMALLVAASSYMPATQMLEPADKVFKQAQLLLTNLFFSGMKKKGAALLDQKATDAIRKKAAEDFRKRGQGTQNVESGGTVQSIDGANLDYNTNQETIDENAVAQQYYDDSYDGTPAESTYAEGLIPTDEIMQLLAEGQSSLNENTDTNLPYPDIFNIQPGAVAPNMSVMAAADIAERTAALRVLKKAEKWLDSLKERKVAETGMDTSTATPGTSAGTAEQVEKEFNNAVENNPKLEAAAATPAGTAMDSIAEATELEDLLKEEGATGPAQTNPVTSQNPGENPKAKEAVASANNVFKTYMAKLK